MSAPRHPWPQFLLRRGVSGDERGIRLLGSRDEPIVHRLPPAREG
jgi:hypothetical protein